MKRNDKNEDKLDLLEQEYEKLQELYVKPGRRLKKKERKSRKSGLELRKGRVLEVYTNNHYRVQIGDEECVCPLSGRYKNVEFDGRTVIAIGDYVNVDFSATPRIEEILERENHLKRFIRVGNSLIEVIMVSNIDQIIITSSIVEPALNLGLVDRYYCSVKVEGILPIICINKIDLVDDLKEVRAACEYYEKCGIKVIYTSATTGEGIDDLRELLKDNESAFSGPSGSGKSSLINAIEPQLDLKVGEVSEATSKGVHTTTSGSLLPWSFGGYLIDTPGIRSFGLDSSYKDLIPRVFPGFDEFAVYCRFGDCKHLGEIGCNVLELVEKGEIPEERYASYHNIMDSFDD